MVWVVAGIALAAPVRYRVNTICGDGFLGTIESMIVEARFKYAKGHR